MADADEDAKMNLAQAPPECPASTPNLPIPRVSLLRFVDSAFPGNSLWT